MPIMSVLMIPETEPNLGATERMKMKIRTRSEARAHYSSLKSDGKLSGTIYAAVAKWADRAKRKERAVAKENRFGEVKPVRSIRRLNGLTTIPLGRSCSVIDRFKAANRRLKEWSLGQKASTSHTQEWTTGDNSNMRKRSTFQRGVMVLSAAKIIGKTLAYQFDSSPLRIIEAPRGYHWDIDQYGVRLVGRLGDYHPDSDDLESDYAGRICVAKLRENAAERKDAKRVAAEIEAATGDPALYVCMADARRAGHCQPGINGWIAKQGLDGRKHYPATIVKRIKDDRVGIVVAMAAKRHAAEMRVGYCELAKHRVQ